MLIDGIRGLDSQPNADRKRDNGEEHRHDADHPQLFIFLLEIGISPKEPEWRNEKTHQIDGGLLAERAGQRPFLKFFAAVLAEIRIRYCFCSAVGTILHTFIVPHIIRSICISYSPIRANKGMMGTGLQERDDRLYRGSLDGGNPIKHLQTHLVFLYNVGGGKDT